MNQRDLQLLKLGSENPKALSIMLKIGALLEKHPVAVIPQDDLARDLGMSVKAAAQSIDSLSELVNAARIGDCWIFAAKEISWKDAGEYEILKACVFRKKASGSEQKEEAKEEAKEAKPAAAAEPAKSPAPAPASALTSAPAPAHK